MSGRRILMGSKAFSPAMVRASCAVVLIAVFASLFHCAATAAPAGQAAAPDGGSIALVPNSSGPVQSPQGGFPYLQAVLEGPSVLATSPSYGEKAQYKISMSGGPASAPPAGSQANWSYKAYVKGDYANVANRTTPLVDSPAKGWSNTTRNFTFNVTAPVNECTITLVVNATSAIAGNSTATESVERTMSIKVVKPVNLHARVRNTGTVTVKDIKVSFYVDKVFIGQQFISSIATNASANVTQNWTVSDYSVGYHTVEMVVISPGSMVRFENGSPKISYEFYVGSLDPDPFAKAWLALGVLLLIIVLVMFILAYMSSGRPGAPPPPKKL